MGGFSFGSSSSKPKALSNWNKYQRQLFKDKLYPMISEGMNGPANAYPGQMYVPQTGQESTYFNRVPELAANLAAMRANLGKPAYNITPEITQQFYESAVRDPALYEWRNVAEPQIRESFTGPGYWGSARANAQAEGAEKLALTLGAQRANLAYADEQARRAALSEAASREATYGAGYATAENELLGTAGQYSRMIEQEKTLADLQRWFMGEEVDGQYAPQFNPFLQYAFAALGLNPISYGTQSSSTNFGLKVG